MTDDPKPKPNFDRRGKPRRGRNPAPVSSVRIDPDAKRALTKYFGSMGNALYFLYEGIERRKEEDDIPNEVHKIDHWKFTQYDVERLFMAMKYYLNNRHDLNGQERRGYVHLMRKLTHSFTGEMYDEAPEDY